MLGEMIAADTGNALFQRNLGATFNYLGRDLRASGRARPAVDNHRRAVGIAERLAASDTGSAEHRHDMAISHYLLAEALAAAHEPDGALEQYHRAAAMKQALRIVEPSNTRHADDLAVIYAGTSAVMVDKKDYDGAEAAMRQSIPLAEAAARRDVRNRKVQVILASTYMAAGRLSARRSVEAVNSLERTTRCEESTGWYQKSLVIWQRLLESGALPVWLAAKPEEAHKAIARCASR
ncbi:MAG: hypothetical protein IPP90_07505 [Gemmatimonadaceae bacterium]|nr:hypothetical protein [Gemmatimonadaceae bacterium]